MTHNDQHATPRAPVRRTLWLAIDDHALPLRRNLHLCISRPTIRVEPVLAPRRDDPLAPDQIAAHFYGTVLQEGGRFRMWYVAFDDDIENKVASARWRAAYAESRDGLHWTKPNLGLVEYRGNKNNNLILTDPAPLGFVNLKVLADPELAPVGRPSASRNLPSFACLSGEIPMMA